ncbi:MAG: HD domain-containing protein [Acutalibacteraceae bacterium]
MLTLDEAEKELKVAIELNPGLWGNHSISVAKNAQIIANNVKGMDSDKAYILGLLHDIGRRAGVTGIMHIFDGYDYMMRINEVGIARICLTHSFPSKNINTYSGKYDCSPEKIDFLKRYINNIHYDDYDILIQLCDAISLPNGACIMEKRFVDVALRNGISEYTLEKWKAFIQAKKHFDKLCNCNIYSLLPNIIENSSTNLI